MEIPGKKQNKTNKLKYHVFHHQHHEEKINNVDGGKKI